MLNCAEGCVVKENGGIWSSMEAGTKYQGVKSRIVIQNKEKLEKQKLEEKIIKRTKIGGDFIKTKRFRKICVVS